MILVDTNILIDIAGPPSEWRMPSLAAYLDASARDELAINPLIFSEFSLGFDTVDACDAILTRFAVSYQEIPKAGLFRATQAFKDYRKRGGSRTSPLPDFFIGGHASASGASILTRDQARYLTYFPEVPLISP